MTKLFYIKSTKYTNRKETNPDGLTVYWGPDNCGYTTNIYQAGVYTENEIGNLDKHTTELIEIKEEPWSKIQISAWGKYIKNEELTIKLHKEEIRDFEEAIDYRKKRITKAQKDKMKMEHELLIQEKLNNNQ